MEPNTTSFRPTGDPLIDEVRAIRHRISEQFGHDIDLLTEHLRELERRQPGRVLQPRDVERRKAARSGGATRPGSSQGPPG